MDMQQGDKTTVSELRALGREQVLEVGQRRGRRKDDQDLEAERLYMLVTDALIEPQEVIDEIANALRRAAGLEIPDGSWQEQPKEAACFHCGAPASGRFSMHRDGFGEGPQLPLCDACGGDEEPTCEAIWARVRERRAREAYVLSKK